MIEEGVKVDEDFTHGGDDGAFVGFASGDEGFDVRADDGVVNGGALSGHVEAFADFGAARADGTALASFAAVAVEGGDASEGNELVAPDVGDFAEMGEDGPCGHLADAAN